MIDRTLSTCVGRGFFVSLLSSSYEKNYENFNRDATKLLQIQTIRQTFCDVISYDNHNFMLRQQ